MATTSTTTTTTTPVVCNKDFVDVRGPRFGGAITAVVLAVALIAQPSALTWVLVVWQAAVFAIGAFVGLHFQPYGLLYRHVIQPRLGPVKDRESTKPPRFAQLVGFVFTLIALSGLVTGISAITIAALAMALAAAFLNAAFGFCLGCEMYLLGKRVFSRA